MLTTPAPRPVRVTLTGQCVDVVPLDPARHGDALWDGSKDHDSLYAYLFEGPYADRAAFDGSLQKLAATEDPLFYAIVDRASGLAVGRAALMRIEPAHRVIEVGSILFTPTLQRTPGATEAMYLMAGYVFDDLGYRRYEWKCNALNAPSRAAAQRLGFSYEGLFRQHMIIKGGNRDTAWYSMIDAEWPARKARFEAWLRPDNFDADGQQRTALSAL